MCKYLGDEEAGGSEAEGGRGDFKEKEVIRLEGDKAWSWALVRASALPEGDGSP